LEKIKWFRFLVRIVERCILKNGLGTSAISVIIGYVNLVSLTIKVNMVKGSNVVNAHLDE